VLLAAGLVAALAACDAQGTNESPTPGTPGDVTENAGPVSPETPFATPTE
jgi:hypothetical protein